MRDAVVLRHPTVDLEHVALVDLHGDDREDVIAESGLVQDGDVSSNDPEVLELSDPARDGADARIGCLGDVAIRFSCVRIQQPQDLDIEFIQSRRFRHRIASPHRRSARSVRRAWGSIEHYFVPYQYSVHSYDLMFDGPPSPSYTSSTA